MTTTSQDSAQERSRAMEPWEQHANVVMPRFSYNVPADLIKQPRSGFLITCTIRREKSATKEAMDLLDKYLVRPMEVIQCGTLIGMEEDTHDTSARDEAKVACTFNEASMKVHQEEYNTLPVICAVCKKAGCWSESVHSGTGSGATTRDTFACPGSSFCTSEEPSEEKEGIASPKEKNRHALNGGCNCLAVEDIRRFSLVKLAANGIIFLSMPEGVPVDTVAVLGNIIRDADAGILKPLKWCHRIIPVQATCSFGQENIHTITLKLVNGFLKQMDSSKDCSLKFAVAFNWRGTDGSVRKSDEANSQAQNEIIFGRKECIDVVVEAVHEAVSKATVNLLEPQMVVIVESLPIAYSQPNNLCVVSVLPGELMNTKPRLCVRPLSLPPFTSTTPLKRKHQ